MSEIQPFTHELVESYLKLRELKYLRDNDGDFVVQFGYLQEADAEISAYFIADGPDKGIYIIRMTTSKRIPASEYGQALAACNNWNMERRWPKVFLYVRTAEDTDAAGVIAEQQIDLRTGIQAELFNSLTDNIVAGGFQFMEWLKQQQNL